MVTSDVEICSLALTRIGHLPVMSLTGGASAPKAETLCALHYPICRDALLRSHPWNFAIMRSTLAQDSTTPNHEFDYRHALPSDCLKVLRTSWEASGFTGAAVYGFPGQSGYANETIPYRIEGRYLLTNESTVSIEYIARITDVAQFDDMFVDVLAQRIAAEIAMPLTDNASLMQGIWKIYAEKLAEARTNDAQEGTPRAIVDLSPWIQARF
jgi:hypothetical protein